MHMPQPDAAVMARRPALIAALRHLVPDGIISSEDALVAYDSDALTAYRQKPMAVVLPYISPVVVERISPAGKPVAL